MRLFAGYRAGFGDQTSRQNVLGEPVDFGVGGQNQVAFGGFIPLLRGLFMNPQHADLQHAELAVPIAENETPGPSPC